MLAIIKLLFFIIMRDSFLSKPQRLQPYPLLAFARLIAHDIHPNRRGVGRGVIRYGGTPELMADYARLALDAHERGDAPTLETVEQCLGTLTAGAKRGNGGARPTRAASRRSSRRRCYQSLDWFLPIFFAGTGFLASAEVDAFVVDIDQLAIGSSFHIMHLDFVFYPQRHMP
ncbi:MAG: hypothetical protein O7G83_06030 [Proteobacteria bacterium]|nr:hypothetical protein [Pseudomonadota bacterium]